MQTKQSFLRLLSLFTILAMVFGLFPVRVAQAAPADLFFSEYIEGSSNNKAVEIYNGTGATVTLTGVYSIYLYSNGAGTATTYALNGSIAAGDVFVVANASANETILAAADATSTTVINYNGDDAVALVKNGTDFVDVIGQIGFDPGTAWGTAPTTTLNATLRRRSPIEAGDTAGNDVFDPAIEWNGFPIDTIDGLGSHTTGPEPDVAPSVTGIVPANGAGGVPLDQNLTVTFSEEVTVANDWFTLSCTSSGVHTAAVSGGPSVFTLDPDADFVPGDTCTFTALAANVTDVDTNEPPDNMLADFVSTFQTGSLCAEPYTKINAIQGSVETSPLVGSIVSTYGVVVGDYEGASPNLRGFYLQSLDADADADVMTSEGVFVFNNNNNNVALGDLVRVTGTVEEYQGQTQLGSVSSIVTCNPSQTVTPATVAFPVATTTALEAYEGMLVTVPQTMTVTEHFQLGRFGQVVLSSDGRLSQPSNVVEPGAPALALQASNNLRKIILDDILNNQNADPIVFGRGGLPLSASNTLRGGDTIAGLIGVMTYTWSGNAASGNAYRIRPQGAGITYNFQPTNPRPASAPERQGILRVANMNLLNYFNTFTSCTAGVGGAATDCRGAETLAEFDRQWPKTVAAIVGTQADVIGIGEIENDGYAPTSAIAVLVDQLNAATTPGTYAFIDADNLTGQVNALGTDAIKVGFLYKPAIVSPVGTAVLNTTSFVNGGDSTARNRPALAVAFELQATGARLVVTTNHLKSKGSACDAPDAGDGQANCNAVRVNAATELAQWLDSDPTGSGDLDNLILGDLNSYAKEDPIDVLLAAGYVNLIEAHNGAEAYSYVFDGQWGYLDHALANTTLAQQVFTVHEWHINADEPSVLDYNANFKTVGQQATLYAPDWFRVSDHDAVLVDMTPLKTAPTANAGGTYSAYEGGSDIQLTGTGTDPQGLALTYAWDLDHDGTFEVNGPNATISAVDGTLELTPVLRVTNSNGETDTAETYVIVYNVQPTVGKITGAPSSVLVGQPVNVSATFTDPGVLDTHTAVWEIWGSSEEVAGVVTETNGSGSVTGQVVFNTPGSHTLILTVVDKDNGQRQVSTTITVYSSFTMQAKGKGIAYSPAGNYLLKPTKSGLGTFDFNARVMKQAKGRYALTGYFNFHVKTLGLNFKSSNVRNLLVSDDGDVAQFVGDGILNSVRGYTYLIQVEDSPAGDRLLINIMGPIGESIYLGEVILQSGSIQVKE